MKASWFSPFKGEVKTLKLTRDPFQFGLGHYTDVDGKKWDVTALRGDGEKPYVNARPIFGNLYYGTSTGGFSQSSTASFAGNDYSGPLHTWDPYYVEVVDAS